MKIDHIAHRVKNRQETANFFITAFNYKLQTEFDIKFPDESTAKCIVLTPPNEELPELFISDGTPGSIVDLWVKSRNNIGGIHHIAYKVNSVANTMKEWREKGYAEFTSEQPMTCPGLVQCFTKPSELTGVIYEFIEREAEGFCKDNVRELMESTKDLT